MTRKTTSPLHTRVGAVCAAAVLLLASACSSDSGKNYDIAPVFPLTANKCEKYNGTAKGSGLTASCMVTKADCERAAADWAAAMKNISDAVRFKC